MNALFAALLHAAATLTGYTDPGALPAIKPATQAELIAIMCPKTLKCPAPTAVYVKRTVYYEERLNLEDEYNRSIIVHEMVHYLQATNGWLATSCDSLMLHEDQAYRVQYRYLLAHNIDRPAVQYGGEHVFCPTEEVKNTLDRFIPNPKCVNGKPPAGWFECNP